jgi:aspartyl-tRNA(Asn)/glutamyl-tRNA(Gln) amidotransferase subunit A
VSELHELSACEVVEGVAAREISPVELVHALLARIDDLDPRLKAWTTVDRDGALAAAKRVESAQSNGGQPGILAGLPIGIKDIYYTAGLKTSANSPLLADFVPESDAAAVTRLRQAGAIILGKTVTTQFADGDPADTRNPWNAQRTPGGSSSGSAAAVAARMVPAALGTQTAGSVLRPAAYCGIVGLKPTFGRITRRNVLPFAWSLDTMGVLVRSVPDAALLLQTLAGYDATDDGSASGPVDDYRAAADRPRAPRLGFLQDFVERSRPDVAEHAQSVANRLDRAGAEVHPLSRSEFVDRAVASQHIIQITEGAGLHADSHAERPASYAPRLRGLVEIGQLVPAEAYLRAQRLRRRFRHEVNTWLRDLDALLLPTASGVAPDPSTTGDPSFQAVWTMLGLPSISLPSGLNGERLPFGTQLVGQAWDETGLLSVARWCEQVFDPLPSPC